MLYVYGLLPPPPASFPRQRRQSDDGARYFCYGCAWWFPVVSSIKTHIFLVHCLFQFRVCALSVFLSLHARCDFCWGIAWCRVAYGYVVNERIPTRPRPQQRHTVHVPIRHVYGVTINRHTPITPPYAHDHNAVIGGFAFAHWT